jgi:glycerate kinase
VTIVSASLRVVIAPDSFKGTATAADVARALSEGWRDERPHDEVRAVPMADGGEGTLEAFAIADPLAARHVITVTGPDDRRVRAEWLLLDSGAAVVELASTSGITLLDDLRGQDSHTIGFGQAIRAALESGVHKLILAIGGSCSSDGGAGLLTALGARLLDQRGRDVAAGNRYLGDVAHIDLTGLRPPPAGGAVVISDVSNPLLGPRGAVSVFGEQKGLSGEVATEAEKRLQHFAQVLAEATGVDPQAEGAGAAGGAGFGLLAWGARLCPGADAVGDALGLPAISAGAHVLITGEGRYDGQSAGDKVPHYVSLLARAAKARVYLVAGVVEEAPVAFDASESLLTLAGSSAAAMSDPAHWLRIAGRRLAAVT